MRVLILWTATILTIIPYAVAISIENIVAVSILLIYRIDRCHQLRCIEHIRCRRTAVLSSIGLGVSEVSVHTTLEPVLRVCIVAYTACVTLELGCTECTILVGVADRHATTVELVTTGNRSLILLTECSVILCLVEPILIPSRLCISVNLTGCRINQSIPSVVLEWVVICSQYTAKHRRSVLTSSSIAVTTGEVSVVVEPLPVELNELTLVYEVVAWNCTLRYTERSFEVYIYSTLLTTLGCDNDNTVSTTSTIQSTCRSVLQHRNRLDIVWVDSANRTTIGNTINNIEWLRVCRDRTKTTNTDS